MSGAFFVSYGGSEGLLFGLLTECSNLRYKCELHRLGPWPFTSCRVADAAHDSFGNWFKADEIYANFPILRL